MRGKDGAKQEDRERKPFSFFFWERSALLDREWSGFFTEMRLQLFSVADALGGSKTTPAVVESHRGAKC